MTRSSWDRQGTGPAPQGHQEARKEAGAGESEKLGTSEADSPQETVPAKLSSRLAEDMDKQKRGGEGRSLERL